MREIFQRYIGVGPMTKEQVAKALKLHAETVRRMAATGKIPRIPGTRKLLFDPEQMIAVFCEPQKPKARSLTIERHKTSGKPKGGFLECL